jgi:hypothetical protein
MNRYVIGVGTAVLAASMYSAPPAQAGGTPAWNGAYAVTFHVDRKVGTSVAASQPENAYTKTYTFASDCSSGECVATIVGGPPSKNLVVPQPMSFAWAGSQWKQVSTWKWDCLLPDGTVEWNPAQSTVNYIPQSDGTLVGNFRTDIARGACAGTVDIPVTAVPA